MTIYGTFLTQEYGRITQTLKKKLTAMKIPLFAC